MSLKSGIRNYRDFKKVPLKKLGIKMRIKNVVLTLTHEAPNPVIFYAAIRNFLVLRVIAE